MKSPQLDLFPDELVRMRLRFRILRNIVVDTFSGCWRWQRRRTKRGGYPLMTMRMPGYMTPRTLIATRVSLEVFVGPPPYADAEAAHDPCCCPYADCVNWKHLRWASRTENEADKRHPQRIKLREIFPPTHRIFEPEDAAIDVPF